MIDKQQFHILNFVKKEPYSGSMDGMRYMIRRVAGEKPAAAETDGASSGDAPEVKVPDRIEVIIWPEPFCLAATDEGLRTHEFFELSEDGVEDVADWLNKQLFDRADEWDAAKEKGCRLS